MCTKHNFQLYSLLMRCRRHSVTISPLPVQFTSFKEFCTHMQLAFVYFVFAHCCCCLTVFFSFVCWVKLHERLMNLALPEQFSLSLSVMRANGRARQQITNVHSSLIRLCDPIQNIGVASAYLSLSNKNDAIICHNHFIIFFGRFSDWRGCCCCCDFLHCARVFSTMPNA